MFTLFKKKPLFSAADAHYLFLKHKPLSSHSRGNQESLHDILGTIRARAKLGYRTLWVKELSEENKETLKELEYKVSETLDKNGYYIHW